jgi:hypothetical protein
MWLRLRRLLAAEEGEVIVGRLKYLLGLTQTH